jgi:RimJ/RimL family protein N-acetyltransferase
MKDRVIYGVYKVENLDDCVGQLALVRIETTNRLTEIGAVIFSVKLQNTTASTEAIYLLMKYCF